MAAVDLYWLPLGAGGHFVRLNGRAYEAAAARLQRRRPSDLYHSALQLETSEGRFVIEQVHDWSGAERGVVAKCPVGARWADRFRIFRYEIGLWPGGHIPDVAEAVNSPQRLSNDDHISQADRGVGRLSAAFSALRLHMLPMPRAGAQDVLTSGLAAVARRC
jgi:hypothetical protein